MSPDILPYQTALYIGREGPSFVCRIPEYKDHLCKLYSTQTWKSVRSLHLKLYQTAMNNGTDDPKNWSKPDTFLEHTILIKQDNSFYNADKWGISRISNNDTNLDSGPMCLHYNQRQDCSWACTYKHISNMWRTSSGHYNKSDAPLIDYPTVDFLISSLIHSLILLSTN